MRKRHLPLLLLLSSYCSYAQADFIGVNIDANNWFYDTTAQSQYYKTQTEFPTNNALQVSLAFEHAVPILPNVKVKYTQLSNDVKSKGGVLPADHTELTNSNYLLYYKVLDNAVNLDVGFGVTQLQGQLNLFRSKTYEKYTLDGNAAAGYVQLGAKLPLTGLSTRAEYTYSQALDVKVQDAQAEIQYDFLRKKKLANVGAKVGYRYMTVDMDAGGQLKSKQEFRGPYAGLNIHF